MKGGLTLKKLIIAFVITLVVATTAITSADAVSVRVGSTEVKKDDVIFVNSTTYVPFRTVSNLLCPEATVSWSDGQAIINAPLVSITSRPGDLFIQANGRCLYAVGGVKLLSNRTFVPVRTLAKAFGASVTWDSASQKAIVTKGSGTISSGDQYYNSDDVYWLSRIINAESSGEPMLGKIAVGDVILNRVASPDYPNTIHDVIFDTKYGVQFEPTANGTIYQTPSSDSVIAAKLCLDGASVVGSCQYFFNPVTASSSWISQNCTYYCTIGNHDFYA